MRAFAELYQTHVGAVRRAVAQTLHDSEAVADAVQDTFVRALERLTTLNNADRFRPWLLSIARHIGVDHARRQSRLDQIDDAEEMAVDGLGPGEDAELRELARLLRSCALELSPRDRTVLALVAELGFTPTDVARSLGLSPSGAKVIVHRARRRLRNALVLRLLLEDPGRACPEFLQPSAGSPSADTARHVRTCLRCIGAASDEVQGFDARLLAADPAATR